MSHPLMVFSAPRFTSCLSRPPHKPKLSASAAPLLFAANAASRTPFNSLPAAKIISRVSVLLSLFSMVINICVAMSSDNVCGKGLWIKYCNSLVIAKKQLGLCGKLIVSKRV